MFQYISVLILPLFLAAVILFGAFKKVRVFESFRAGAKTGLDTAASIFPTYVGMVVAVMVMRASGVLDAIVSLFDPVAAFFHIPTGVMPIAILRPISGSGAFALLQDLFKNEGPDSFIGKLASVIEGANETTFYVFSLYFASIGIKRTRQTLFCAVFADAAALIAACFFSRLFFGS